MSADTLHAALGLPQDAALDRLVVEVPPAAPRARGLAPASAPPLDRILDSVFQAVSTEALPVAIERSVFEPAVVRVESPHPLTPLYGACSADRDGLALDTRVEAAALLVHAPEALAIRVDHGTVEVFRVPSDARLDAWRPPLPHPAPPSLSDLLGRHSLRPALRARHDALAATGDPLDAVAAAGTVARLWFDPDPAARRAAIEALLARDLPLAAEPVATYGASDPAAALAAWARALPDADIARIERRALVAVGQLEGTVDALHAAALDDAGAPVLYDLVARRDALESVRYVLGLRGAGDTLARAVRSLDTEVQAAWSAVLAAGPVDLPWLSLAATDTPDAWWVAWAQEP